MLKAELVERGIAGTAFPRLHYVARTGSTNDDAVTRLGDPAWAGSLLVAEEQTAGRGRRGRQWFAPPGSALLVTAVLPRTVPTAALWAVPFWTALCVADALERGAGIRCGLQWPNDMLLAGRKVCGILGISRVDGERAYVACGTGINVLRPPGEDADLAAVVPPPIFCSDAKPAWLDGYERETLLVELAKAYDRALDAFADPAAIGRTWEARAQLAGTPYRILRDGESEAFDARAVGLGNDGTLIVDRDGDRLVISQADARVLR